uniref:UspA domain-containing protein n=1 Tax=Kalanchoe fedtschenkoi TaxID=63787 RepID=A0A7N0T225_KALFE
MGENSSKAVMVVGIDESEHSTYALKWTLDHFFASPELNKAYKLVLVHARASPSAVISLASHGATEVVAIVTDDLKKMAQRVTDQAKNICISKGVEDLMVEVVEGEPRGVICEAVDRHHASILVVGSHGYGAIKRAVLGSVSDYCAHHAHCSVLIVKKPKTKD